MAVAPAFVPGFSLHLRLLVSSGSLSDLQTWADISHFSGGNELCKTGPAPSSRGLSALGLEGDTPWQPGWF